MNKNLIKLLLCIVVLLSTIFIGCKKNIEPTPTIIPDSKSGTNDHYVRELAEMHNKAFKELVDSYVYQPEAWQEAFLASINNLSLLDEKEKEMLIEELVNNGWLSMNSCDEYVERIVNEAFETIGNCNFEHHDIVMKYVNQCIDLTNNITYYDQFVSDLEKVVENARHELKDDELIAVQSIAYVFESTSYLWLPQEMGGSGIALSFILSINPEFDYGAFTKDIPTWLRDGLIADGGYALYKSYKIYLCVLAGGVGWAKLAVEIGAWSVGAALYSAVQVKPNRVSSSDLDLKQLGILHNDAVYQLIGNFNTSTDNLQDEMNRCISIMDGLTDEDKDRIINKLNESEWWNQGLDESTERLINNLYENIQNGQFEKKEALLLYLEECINNVYELQDLNSLKHKNTQLLKAATKELGKSVELDILKSLVYVANSSAELWLPESHGGTGVFGDFINSFGTNLRLSPDRGKPVPRWVLNGILNDAISAATTFSFCWWAITTPQGLLAVAIESGVSSAIAAVQTYIEDKPKH